MKQLILTTLTILLAQQSLAAAKASPAKLSKLIAEARTIEGYVQGQDCKLNISSNVEGVKIQVRSEKGRMLQAFIPTNARLLSTGRTDSDGSFHKNYTWGGKVTLEMSHVDDGYAYIILNDGFQKVECGIDP